MQVKKLHPDAKLPLLAHEDDAGYDIAVIDDGTLELVQIKEKMWRVKYLEYRTGLAIAVPEGFHIEIVARSSVSKSDLILANCLAIGDNGYRNEYKLRFRVLPLCDKEFNADTKEIAIEECKQFLVHRNISLFKAGDRAAQLLIRRTIHSPVEEVDDLDTTERNMGGFGSTGS